MDADIGAAIDRGHPGAVILPAKIEQPQHRLYLRHVVGRVFQYLVADADAGIVAGQPVVKTVDDHRAVVRRGEDEGDLTAVTGHGIAGQLR